MHSPSNAEGPDTACAVVGPLDVERFGRRLDTQNSSDTGERQVAFVRRLGVGAERPRVLAPMTSLQSRAREVVDDLVGNGASFSYQAAVGARPASFVYELTGPGDRKACRRIIAEAKTNPDLWRAVVVEIGARDSARTREAA